MEASTSNIELMGTNPSSKEEKNKSLSENSEKDQINDCNKTKPTQIISDRLFSSRNIDSLLDLCCQWSSNATLSEQSIKLIQWSLWLISQLTKNNKRIHRELSTSLRKIYSDLSMMRYVLRLYGIPQALQGIRSGSWSGGEWKDKRIHKLASVMAWSMLFYHPLEHVAWAQWSMPKLLPRIDGNKWSAWSCRFWMIYIAADWATSLLKNIELRKRKQQLTLTNSIGHANDGNDLECRVKEYDKAIKMNQLQIIRCALFTFPCLNWSMDKWATEPLLSENVVNGLSWGEAIACIYQSIYSLRT